MGEYDFIEPWMGDRARYEVTVAVPSIGTETYSTDDFTEMFDSWDGAACYDVLVSIEPDVIAFSVGVDVERPPETRQDA